MNGDDNDTIDYMTADVMPCGCESDEQHDRQRASFEAVSPMMELVIMGERMVRVRMNDGAGGGTMFVHESHLPESISKQRQAMGGRARPPWLTDPMLAEMRRLRESDTNFRENPCASFGSLQSADYKHNVKGEPWWVRRERGLCWLTPTGHRALAAIEAEEVAEQRDRDHMAMEMLRAAAGRKGTGTIEVPSIDTAIEWTREPNRQIPTDPAEAIIAALEESS